MNASFKTVNGMGELATWRLELPEEILNPHGRFQNRKRYGRARNYYKGNNWNT